MALSPISRGCSESGKLRNQTGNRREQEIDKGLRERAGSAYELSLQGQPHGRPCSINNRDGGEVTQEY
jgi:hypothetical protein